MSKNRNIDDAELANISGAGDLEIAKKGEGVGASDIGGTGSRPSEGSGGVTGPENDTNSGGDVEFGPA